MALPGAGIRVGLFATCINDLMFPQTAQATVTVLRRLGCQVEFPPAQTCCGQMMTNTGYFKQALGSVKAFTKAFEPYDAVVAPSGSCVASVRHQHPMLAQPAGSAKWVAAVEATVAKTYDISEFLVDVLGVVDVGAFFPHRVTYHPSCHSARIARLGQRPYDLLKAVKGLELLDLPDADQCCGFGGTFSVKNPDVSVALAMDKASNAIATGAEYLVAPDNACLMNVGGILSRDRAGVKPIHLVEILAQTEEVDG
ncbi:MAG: (Fe-S)-binding protein [Bifidobacteriaceae bacterium]|jgi:L-lactate dehydrogenase complex protein LldE|nr:(Fe-S)-binding protein [Bifidobacteriaceae bacterium]